jgi:excinuclease UvrABC ATPase subunit
MIERCSCCLGKKTIMGLGSMIKDCPECDGIGHVKVDHVDGYVKTEKAYLEKVATDNMAKPKRKYASKNK